MRVTQALFQTQHPLAENRKTEMSRLDGAGMNRPDRNFVHTFSADRHESIVVLAARRGLGGIEIVPQRVGLPRPRAMAQPGTLIARAFRADAKHVGHGSLHAIGRRKQIAQVRKRGLYRQTDP